MSLDLICPSFAPLPTSMWVAASAMIDVIIQKCWLLLAAFVTIKVLTDALQDYEHWLPGPFQRSFQHWLKSYVHISCWAITLSILAVFIDAFSGASLEGGLIPTLIYNLLSLILLIAIFMTPTWTAKFTGSALLSNFVTSVGGLASQGGKIGVHYTKKLWNDK